MQNLNIEVVRNSKPQFRLLEYLRYKYSVWAGYKDCAIWAAVDAQTEVSSYAETARVSGISNLNETYQ